MKNIKIFENPAFGQVRTMCDENDVPWFVGKDVAVVLGYSNHRKALIDHVEEEDKTDGVTIRDSIGRSQNPTLINESGLYSLIMSSKLPLAKEFKRWVTSEVIPSIRKNGGYLHTEENESPEEIMAKALILAQQTIDRKNAIIEEQKPKVLFADTMGSSETLMTITNFIRSLISQKPSVRHVDVWEWFVNKGFLCKDKKNPTTEAVRRGLMKQTCTCVSHNHGIESHYSTKITGKGQEYFLNRLIKEVG